MLGERHNATNPGAAGVHRWALLTSNRLTPAMPTWYRSPMSGLVKCRGCGSPISARAESCPHCGEPGGGKSHLLQATCQWADAAGRRAIYVPLRDLAASARSVESLEADLLALDDVESWLGDAALEPVLLGLYQQQLQAGGQIVFAAVKTAQQSCFSLADLGSRCRALPGYRVVMPDDEGLRAILTAAAHRRGLTLTSAVLDYWLHRAVRALPELMVQLQRLDEQALVEQRAITIPLIKEVLEL